MGPMARHVNSALRRKIGTQLRELRLAAGITSQEALAHRVGVHATYIGRLERGESGVTLEVLSAVLAAMSMSLAEFFEPFDHVIRPRRLPIGNPVFSRWKPVLNSLNRLEFASR